MKFKFIYLPVILLVIILNSGCTVGRGSGVFPPESDIEARPALSLDDDGSDHRIIIANGLSENTTLVERTDETWHVTQGVFQTGMSPSQIILHDGLCYIVNSLSNSIQIVDPYELKIVREISTGAGTNPNFLAFINDTDALVSCYLSNEVLLIDLSEGIGTENRIIKSIALPDSENLPHDEGDITYARPGGIAVVDNIAFVACSNLNQIHEAGGPGIIVEIDIDKIEIARIQELNGRNTVQVLHSPRFPDRIVVMSAGDHTVADGFVGNGMVESIDINSGKIFQSVNVDGSPYGGAIGPGDILFMENAKEGNVLRVDLKTGTVLDSFKLPEYGLSLSFASSIVALPGLILATNFNSDLLSLIDPMTGEILAELQTGDGPDAMVCVE
ncbi:MAG: hypothetical protein NTY09_14730 [bacterium]|nr:hypothetical protein [bacterium]